MDVNEMSNQFDVLYNNITSNQAPGLNEYEKSIFLTKAQSEVVKNYFLPQSNAKQAGFDANQKRQADFSMLMQHATPIQLVSGVTKYDPRSWVYKMPTDLFVLINEQFEFIEQGSEKTLGIRQVIPISYDEYTRLMSKPYKEPLKYQAWRLLTSTTVTTESQGNEQVDKGVGVAEIILTTKDRTSWDPSNVRKEYHIRYLKKPKPIVLTNLDSALGEGLSIEGVKEETPCELDPMLHEEILQRAVELAKAAWQGDVNTVVQIGQRSE